jgi:hypothetical protein
VSDDQWSIRLEPAVLLPGRSFTASIGYTPARDHPSRGVKVVLRCVERYRYDQSETVHLADGSTSVRRVTRTGVQELARLEVAAAGPTTFIKGQAQSWEVTFEVPGLGPATFEGEVLRCDWTLTASIDIAMAIDERIEQAVVVAQPMALLRAGVLDTGMYGLFEEAPVNLDAHPAQVRLKPVPISLQSAFSGSFTVETAAPLAIQEVRLELRVTADVTVSGGHHEEIVVWRGGLEAATQAFGGALTEHSFEADAPGAWTPSIDLPHGKARGQFHVILALRWEPDIHYVRDVALATTSEL